MATVSRHLAGELEAAGHTVSVLAPPAGGHTPYAEGQVVPLALGTPRLSPLARLRGADVRYRQAVAAALASLDPAPDAVIAHNDPRVARWLAARLVGSTRVLLWLHNVMEGPAAKALAALPRVCQPVAVSYALRRRCAEVSGLSEERIAVVHNGVDLMEFRPRPSYRDPQQPLAVLCHGRVAPGKGPDVAVAAVRRLQDEGMALRITVAGPVRAWSHKDSDLARYASEVQAATSGAGGEFLGALPADEIAALVAGHDVACVLSRTFEPFSLAALEAMASGLAVVATRRGALPEVVGEVGQLVEADDVEATAAALRVLASDPERLVAAKEAGRRRAASFTWRRSAGELLGLLGWQAPGRVLPPTGDGPSRPEGRASR